MGTLNDIGLKLNADKSTRLHNYLDFYQEHLPGRDFNGRLLEIGVMDGLSMRMWREYYPNAEIVGIDIKDMDHMHNHYWRVPESVQLVRCDGTDPEQTKKLGKFDVIIDDGSHYWGDQQKSFETLYYGQLNEGGVYVLEDLWTSYIHYYADAEVHTVEYLERLESQGMEMTFFRHKHENGNGLQDVFPDLEGLSELESITVVIEAGQ